MKKRGKVTKKEEMKEYVTNLCYNAFVLRRGNEDTLLTSLRIRYIQHMSHVNQIRKYSNFSFSSSVVLWKPLFSTRIFIFSWDTLSTSSL